MRIPIFVHRILETLNRRSRAIYLCGLLFSICYGLASSAPYLGDGKKLARDEMTTHGDAKNLYEAAAAATWADAPRWWVGRWNYPGMNFYRPLTSMLFLAEQKSF